MRNRNVYLVQFGSGTSINLLPLAAGMLYSRARRDALIQRSLRLQEIVFLRPDNPYDLIARFQDVAVVGFSCFLWNTRLSLDIAQGIKARFPHALIVFGGPAVPNEGDEAQDFLRRYPFVDVIARGEGEEVFVDLCHHYLGEKDLPDIPGVVFRNAGGDGLVATRPGMPDFPALPSPFLDGTFDDFYAKYGDVLSGIIWETNRGCPYSCSFCTWGNYDFHKVRRKPLDVIEREVAWIGRFGIGYIAMSDANFGILKEDVVIAELLAESKRKFGCPDFISVSWAKNSSKKVLRIADILSDAGIGFRITLSLQSLHEPVLKKINRSNIKLGSYREIKENYRKRRLYSYTELILALPGESKESFLEGMDRSLSDSVYDQLYVYPCLLFPNTELARRESRERFGIEGNLVPNRYTKSKEFQANNEKVEIVIATAAMPREAWRETFTLCYHTLALHDDRLCFFVMQYLRREYGIGFTDLIAYMCSAPEYEYPVLRRSFQRLEERARLVQENAESHLMEPEGFGGIPYDPAEAVFLELIYHKDDFYAEFSRRLDELIVEREINCRREELGDLFVFQGAVMADPRNTVAERSISLRYNWVDYFRFAFCLESEPLVERQCTYRVVDTAPSCGDRQAFLKDHFDVRGVPAFNLLYVEEQRMFPPEEAARSSGRII